MIKPIEHSKITQFTQTQQNKVIKSQYFNDLEEKILKDNHPTYTRPYNIAELHKENLHGISPSDIKYKKPIICGICTKNINKLGNDTNLNQKTNEVSHENQSSTSFPIPPMPNAPPEAIPLFPILDYTPIPNPIKLPPSLQYIIPIKKQDSNEILKKYGMNFNQPRRKININTKTNIKVYPSSKVVTYTIKEEDLPIDYSNEFQTNDTYKKRLSAQNHNEQQEAINKIKSQSLKQNNKDIKSTIKSLNIKLQEIQKNLDKSKRNANEKFKMLHLEKESTTNKKFDQLLMNIKSIHKEKWDKLEKQKLTSLLSLLSLFSLLSLRVIFSCWNLKSLVFEFFNLFVNFCFSNLSHFSLCILFIFINS